MSDVKILSVERTGVPDQLAVVGTVEGHTQEVPAPTQKDPNRTRTQLAPISIFVWESALYGDPIHPDAMDESGRYHRAPDKLGGEDESAVHAEEHAGPRDPQVPQTDAQRRKYLIGELEAVAKAAQGDPKLQKLTD